MNVAMPLFLLSALLSVLLNTGLARIALARNWCDQPGRTKIHLQPVPFIGGLGIFSVWTIALLVTAVNQLRFLLPPALLALAIGTWDDLHWKTASVPGRKLALQSLPAISAALLVSMHFPVPSASPFVTGGYFLFSFLFTLTLINAVNLADGIDGLAGGETIISLFGLTAVYSALKNPELSFAALLLAAAIIGFLVLNLQSPSRLFLGDGGSHLLGTLLAIFSLPIIGMLPDIWTFFALLLIIGLPLIDLLWIIFIRGYRRQPLFAPDRNHLYDIIADAGLGRRATLLILCILQSFLVYTGTVILLMQIP